ncbi:MAG: glycoside hydrolase N-terminal domain-containing protein, partial [Bacteroidales bacterium]|nr:glycoside hydrolase N-terminal domain-containing protein [Bacteroidales bacterium]
MKKNLTFLLTIVVALSASAHNEDYKLWYDEPATRFEEALPLGNGRIGLTVYGGVEQETINLNEETLWGGGPTNTNPTPDASQYLPQV